ncbi:flagellar export protein FliJ [Limnobacter humi]|uniref:Flagellar FliJ protein n=1 Tax=Limnobacter humi TaxID=1778671 RepID=A0ABT1WKG1_9BURK|nr:flagellar export protein FliJ [Limnobacter humi]MCQ8897518.1 flagellar export protein FliJ [Limnobacter humi]
MSKAIELLKDRISLEVSEMESHMALIQSSIEKGQHSIHMLTDYVRQYSEKLAFMGQCTAVDELTPHTISGTELKAHNQFAGKLMSALAAQVRQNETNKAYLRQAAENLKHLKLKQKTLEQLLARREAVLEEKQLRREQKELDELANGRYARTLLLKSAEGRLA